MPADPAAMDALFNSRGGFEHAYKKLIAVAKALLRIYGGDSSARVVLRQLDGEEVVNRAFERWASDGFPTAVEPYLVMRGHIRNHIRSIAKSAKQRRTVRVDGNEDLTWAYQQQFDPTEETAIDRLLIIDDRDFCIQVMFRLVADTRDDQQVTALATAIIDGFRDPADICELTGLDKPAYEATFKRLKRRFTQTLDAMRKDEK
jgi:hypothetical protein